jgi:hypothetical protein
MILVAPSQSTVARQRRQIRFVGVAMLLVGAVMILIALGVFLTQGSQIQVTGTVLSERCHQQFDPAIHQSETRCDAAVRFMTRTGQVITTMVTDAFPYEFHHMPGQPATIRLRYDSNDPAHPYKQSNYMSAGQFLLVLGIGVPAAGFGAWWLARAERIAVNAARRLARHGR